MVRKPLSSTSIPGSRTDYPEMETLKRLAGQLEKENEELERKYDSQKTAK